MYEIYTGLYGVLMPVQEAGDDAILYNLWRFLQHVHQHAVPQGAGAVGEFCNIQRIKDGDGVVPA